MTRASKPRQGFIAGGRSLLRETKGAAALEAAIIMWPFLFVVLVALQMGIYYMTQSALNSGVNAAAASLRNGFSSTPPPTPPTASQLKTNVVNGAGGMVYNGSGLAVEIRQLSSLSGGSVAVTDGTVDYGSSGVPLALRATSAVVAVAPGFSSLMQVESTAIVRHN